jgi:hypothetical protein
MGLTIRPVTCPKCKKAHDVAHLLTPKGITMRCDACEAAFDVKPGRVFGNSWPTVDHRPNDKKVRRAY